jgi:hypothetical protein
VLGLFLWGVEQLNPHLIHHQVAATTTTGVVLSFISSSPLEEGIGRSGRVVT